MSYRLVWLPSARDTALQIVLTRADRAAIVGSLDRLTGTLHQEGPSAGESRDVDFRVAFDSPLAVKFSIDERDRAVTITDIWTIR